FVRIDEANVKEASKVFQRLQSRPKLYLDFARMRALGEIAPGNFRGFRIDVARNDSTVFGKRLGPSERAVSREHADLQNSPGAGDERQQFEETSLERTYHHPGIARFG